MGAEISSAVNYVFPAEENVKNERTISTGPGGESPGDSKHVQAKSPQVPPTPASTPRSAPPIYYNIEDIVNSDMDTVVDTTDRESISVTNVNKAGRKIALVRRAETMSEAFPGWYSSCVSKDHYVAKDLNHPAKLPLRSRGFTCYENDPPVTRLAEYASKILGAALATDSGIKWDLVVTAPELASIQTGFALASSTTGDKLFVSIDETLCEFSHRKMEFMTQMELLKLDVSANITQMAKLKDAESSLSRVEGEIEKVQGRNAGNLIIVVGPTAFDAIMQRLLGSPRASRKKKLLIPQLACVIMEKGSKSWSISKKQILPMRTNNASAAFDPNAYVAK